MTRDFKKELLETEISKGIFKIKEFFPILN